MLSEVKFTDARTNFTNVIDQVQSFSPIVIQPRKKSEEYTFLLKESLVSQLLDGYTFQIDLTDEEPGSCAYWMNTFDIYGYGNTPDQALDSLVEDVVVYVEQYLANPVRFFNSPNRRHHLPYVLKITLCNNNDEIKQMLLADAASVQRS